MRLRPSLSYLERYDNASSAASREIISSYSTSFSLATKLLAPRVRRDIAHLYAMVRIADEIVDGTAGEAQLSTADVSAELDAYEQRVLLAPRQRFHTDPVLHAYGQSARRCGFKEEYIRAFFASMRRDLHQTTYDALDFAAYVYGSAEVIGLLCLQAFIVDIPITTQERELMEEGARALGAAFQKINFLRDLSEDSHALGRRYFPQLAERELNDATKKELIDDIRHDLRLARTVIPHLPYSSRMGVIAATDFFAELTRLLDQTPTSDIYSRRVSVSSITKTKIFVRAIQRAFTTTSKDRI
ncbi:phytoene/squalene synthase family protein [Corynebacterium sp. ES2794-CONJ1]|uniref:phytoene/squalene synthase family protein n=1 Tax=unclassified Corynebacterium TaxID=2624378 RepID=UPI002169E783|nr:MULTISPECIES: phytoene/squalene synthase family protein [unclassified Corynebacterium]MCS4490564.1 phytoene/squalene synthase family protein [Corynebacterium sp. ES2775-CONJ]MCS4492343.1 phytoene/squalene synthase family protein [Corynebacterium sp. ES2715-CONJ3]MCS4532465.1 phytoene/squalene synthase family protein [Corynebacterium sp. ES2730-CONJ]MCU9519860.1 phytoene/squalene synthase family protein [Corynebacterium sp. ES2794-CONJ1]